MIVSAIVPAFNEVARIKTVLEVLKNTAQVHEIIVVDDGSVDGTGECAKSVGVTVCRNEWRYGKGESLDRGVRSATGDVLFFCDADITGLSPSIVESIIMPVSHGDCDMSIGARKSKVRQVGFGYTISPLLDGQRALHRALWERVPTAFKKRYRVEVALNRFAHRVHISHFDLSQATKEEKFGPLVGTFERYCMYVDILAAHGLSILQTKRLFYRKA